MKTGLWTNGGAAYTTNLFKSKTAVNYCAVIIYLRYHLIISTLIIYKSYTCVEYVGEVSKSFRDILS